MIITIIITIIIIIIITRRRRRRRMEFSSGHSRWWLICFECFQVELDLRILVYAEEGKPEDLERNPREKNENNHKLNSHVISCPGVEPEPQLLVYPTRLISHLFCFVFLVSPCYPVIKLVLKVHVHNRSHFHSKVMLRRLIFV